MAENTVVAKSVLVPLTLANGVRIRVEASPQPDASAAKKPAGEADVAYDGYATLTERDVVSIPASFDDIAKTIEGIAGSLTGAIKKVAPKRASVEFGLEFQAESGGLTALIVKGTATANLKITLEWSD
jgi:hypothetical protein